MAVSQFPPYLSAAYGKALERFVWERSSEWVHSVTDLRKGSNLVPIFNTESRYRECPYESISSAAPIPETALEATPWIGTRLRESAIRKTPPAFTR
jgi:hypothetical protein